MSEVRTPDQHHYAQLDAKTGKRVLCSHPACGATLAEVVLVPKHVSWSHEARSITVRGADDPIRLAVMLPGWTQGPDGTWYRTKHASQELRRRDRLGETQRITRRAPKASVRDRFEERRATGEKTGRRLGMLYAYPVLVRCADCSRLNILDAERLRLCPGLEDLPWPMDLLPYVPQA